MLQAYLLWPVGDAILLFTLNYCFILSYTRKTICTLKLLKFSLNLKYNLAGNVSLVKTLTIIFTVINWSLSLQHPFPFGIICFFFFHCCVSISF